MSLTAVLSGNVTASNDINQIINMLNGAAAGQAILLASSSAAASPLIARTPSVPTSDNEFMWVDVTGDSTSGRAALGVRSTGVGVLFLGHGGSAAWDAILYAISGGGLKTDQSLNAVNGLYDNGNRVAIEGSHSNAGQPIISVGTGAPASLGANEVYIQLS